LGTRRPIPLSGPYTSNTHLRHKIHLTLLKSTSDSSSPTCGGAGFDLQAQALETRLDDSGAFMASGQLPIGAAELSCWLLWLQRWPIVGRRSGLEVFGSAVGSS
jgi:hypothetical protein